MTSLSTSAPTSLALAPARNGIILLRNRKKPNPNPDALVLFSSLDEGSSNIIGRHELRIAHWQTCPCNIAETKTRRIGDRGDSDSPARASASPSSATSASVFCSRCEYPWTKHMERKFLKLDVDKNEKAADEAKLWIKTRQGTYPVLDKMIVNGKRLRGYGLKSQTNNDNLRGQLQHQVKEKQQCSWLGPLTLRVSDSISFQPITTDSDEARPMEFQVVAQQGGHQISQPQMDTPSQKINSLVGVAEHESPDNTLLHSSPCDSETQSPLKTQQHNTKDVAAGPESTSRFPHLFQSSESQEEEESQHVSLDGSPLLFTPPILAKKLKKNSGGGSDKSAAKLDLFGDKQAALHDDNGSHDFKPPKLSDLVSTAEAIPDNMDQVVGVATVSVDDGATAAGEDADADAAPPPKLYFIKCNRHSDMFNKTTREVAKRKAIARGAVVMEQFDRQDPPTHFIVGNALRMDEGDLLNEDLRFHSVQELHQYMETHDILFARLKWVTRGGENTLFGSLAEDERYYLALSQPKASIQAVATGKKESPRKRPRQEEAPDSQVLEYKNKELNELFEELSMIYREAPVEDHDLWRAYTFNRAASVVRHLPFGVTYENVDQLKQQKGFSKSCVDIAREYVLTGTCERRRKLLVDEHRIAMMTFTRIWGVGPKRAADLYKMGYRSIADLRTATQSGKLRWQRNEYLGLKYYEDIDEEMSREEAELIVDIVRAAANSRQFYPTAEVQAMGSYRRRKETCGDVDFIISDPDWEDEVPATFLGRLVEKLQDDGFVVHHLTLVRGMDSNSFETLVPSEKKFILSTFSSSSDKRPNKARDKRSYTWFGICRSPMFPNKVRRVDIKVYPYSEHIYAALYFTGNGHFNRAMRFWSKKKKKEPRYHLDDHGLWLLNASGKVLLDDEGNPLRATEPDGSTFVPQTEKDVFAKLDLVWKEPHERDGFAALQSKEDGANADLSLSMGDIMSDSREYTWVD